MKNNVLLLFIVLLLVSSCDLFVEKYYGFEFNNKGEKDLYAIIDFDVNDGQISLGSWVEFIPAETCKAILNTTPWLEVVAYKLQLYIIDATKVDLECAPITEYYLSKVTPDMILARVDLYHEDFRKQGELTVSYPPESE